MKEDFFNMFDVDGYNLKEREKFVKQGKGWER